MTARAHSNLIPTGDLLRQILVRDGWTYDAATATAQQGQRRINFFFQEQGETVVRRALRRIASDDAGKLRELGVVVVPTRAELHRCRDERLADRYPRAFFLAAEELAELEAGTLPTQHEKPGDVATFTAEIVANKQIGGAGSPYYVLTFKSPEIHEVWPSQFVMMDCAPTRLLLAPRAVRRGSSWKSAVPLAPWPILKRPFGIQRAYYRHFDKQYLRRLALPPALAPVLHTVYPHEFDLLYKVLPDGIGTPLMTELAKGDEVHMVGPLGRPYDVRGLRAAGVEEVHLVGGGVGMAPLIYFVQALRYYSFRVKVFIGISKIDILRHTGDVDYAFAEEPGNAYVYVDDLIEAGMAPADIYLAFDAEAPAKTVRGIPRENLFKGFVTEQYRQFLQRCHPERSEGSPSFPQNGEILRCAQNDSTKKVMAFTCGPDRMMELVWGIAQEAGVPLKVLMEKRMGCGFGVCLSCVCKVRRADGSEDYSRVCTEGPVYDAGEILWKENDSKSQSVNCGCARPC